MGHTHSGGTATCVSKAVCGCGQEYGEVDSNAHNYEEDWKSDEARKWDEWGKSDGKRVDAGGNRGVEEKESTAQYENTEAVKTLQVLRTRTSHRRFQLLEQRKGF